MKYEQIKGELESSSKELSFAQLKELSDSLRKAMDEKRDKRKVQMVEAGVYCERCSAPLLGCNVCKETLLGHTYIYCDKNDDRHVCTSCWEGKEKKKS